MNMCEPGFMVYIICNLNRTIHLKMIYLYASIHNSFSLIKRLVTNFNSSHFPTCWFYTNIGEWQFSQNGKAFYFHGVNLILIVLEFSRYVCVCVCLTSRFHQRCPSHPKFAHSRSLSLILSTRSAGSSRSSSVSCRVRAHIYIISVCLSHRPNLTNTRTHRSTCIHTEAVHIIPYVCAAQSHHTYAIHSLDVLIARAISVCDAETWN